MRFDRLLREAAKHFTTNGYTSRSDINDWRVKLLSAAEAHLDVEGAHKRVGRILESAYWKALGAGRIAKKHGSVPKYAIDQLEPKLRDELERRIFATQELVEGDKRVALERLQQRFLGLATAGPNPGEAAASATAIGKVARDSRAQERMIAVDQTKKMVATMDEVIAEDGGSIGGFWDATWDIARKHRPEHAARHDKFYVRRASWADEQVLIRHPNGFMDEWDMPGVLINCQCEYNYVYDLADVPDEFKTAKGKEAA
jgi:hypothetical protein